MTIKRLVFARNIYITCLIAELNIEYIYIYIYIYISYTIYFKSKNNFKSSILNHTRIYALKPSYSYVRV
jgi:hypothetical protein